MKKEFVEPAIGRIVHAVVKNFHGTFVERPALITQTWGKGCTQIQCTVFFDGFNDGGTTACKSSLPYYGTPCHPVVNTPDASIETWHWPQDNHTNSGGETFTPSGEFVPKP